MAVITVSSIGGNWNATTTWVGGVVPLITDTVDFTATSGDLTINVASQCVGIDFTNYIGTLTVNTTLRINGDINFGSGGYTVAGGSTTFIGANGTITSNGVVWTGNFGFIGSGITFSLADDLTVNGNINMNANSSFINGFTIYAKSSWLHTGGNLNGTTNLVFNGTGIWNHTTAFYIGLNTTIDTIGTITLGANVRYQTGVLTYIAGTVVTAGSTLIIGGACILNTSGMTWNNITLTASVTITLTSILIVEGTLSIAGSSFATSACHVKGNLTITGNTGTGGIIIINGTGNQTWSGANRVRTDLQINKPSGTLTVSGAVSFSSSTLTYIAGNVDTTGSTLTFDVTSTIDTNDLFWNDISFISGAQNLISDLNCQNLTSGGNTINGLFNINVNGNLTANGVVQGTSTIILIGTGLWTALNGSNTFRTPIVINTNGVITLANTLYHEGSLTYIKGTVKSNNTTITFAGNKLINLHKLIFKNIIISVGTTITMNEFFSGSPSIVTNISSINSQNYTITFQDNFEKISKFVNIRNCTLSKPLQLLVLTNSKRNLTNRGIRYINQSPNGIAKGVPSINAPMTFGVAGLLSDPNM